MSTSHPVAPRMGLMRTPASGVAGEGGILPSGTTPHAGPDTAAATARARALKIADRPSPPTMPPRSSTAALEAPSYEQALAELEALVQAMEAGKMPLDKLLASYQRGAELLQLCRGRLQVVEDQVRLLEDGALKPWLPA